MFYQQKFQIKITSTAPKLVYQNLVLLGLLQLLGAYIFARKLGQLDQMAG
jgi:hypothetical protein